MTFDSVFLKYSNEKLLQLLGRINDCSSRLSDSQIWMRGAETQNAVGNLILHLNGNVRQWILSGVGGLPDDRVRDKEFAARGQASGAELRERLGATIQQAVTVIAALTPERLLETVNIQKYDVTVLEAVYHVVEHFAEHTAQIIFATKALTGEDLGYYRHLNALRHGESTP